MKNCRTIHSWKIDVAHEMSDDRKVYTGYTYAALKLRKHFEQYHHPKCSY